MNIPAQIEAATNIHHQDHDKDVFAQLLNLTNELNSLAYVYGVQAETTEYEVRAIYGNVIREIFEVLGLPYVVSSDPYDELRLHLGRLYNKDYDAPIPGAKERLDAVLFKFRDVFGFLNEQMMEILLRRDIQHLGDQAHYIRELPELFAQGVKQVVLFGRPSIANVLQGKPQQEVATEGYFTYLQSLLTDEGIHRRLDSADCLKILQLLSTVQGSEEVLRLLLQNNADLFSKEAQTIASQKAIDIQNTKKPGSEFPPTWGWRNRHPMALPRKCVYAFRKEMCDEAKQVLSEHCDVDALLANRERDCAVTQGRSTCPIWTERIIKASRSCGECKWYSDFTGRPDPTEDPSTLFEAFQQETELHNPGYDTITLSIGHSNPVDRITFEYKTYKRSGANGNTIAMICDLTTENALLMRNAWLGNA